MSPQPLTMSASYLATVRGLRELHELTATGRLDSPEADAVRDAADAPWGALTEEEKRRISGLSEDLYLITDPAQTAVKEKNPQSQARLVDVYQARQRGEWDRVFELLRRWGAYLDPSLLSYLRGATWVEAGDPATAAIFYKHASELQPDNGNYLALCLNTLNKVASSEAQRRAEEILREPDKFQPVVVAHASNIMFDLAKELPEAEAAKFFRKLIPKLESALGKVEQGDEGGVDGSTFSMACALLGFCHEFLGENQAALGYYSKGLTVNPTNDALLVARGILLYGESPRAIDDFRLAIQQGSTLVWPYFSSLTTTLSPDSSSNVAISASEALRREDQTLSIASSPSGWQSPNPNSASPLIWSEDRLTHRSASTRPTSERVETWQPLRRPHDRSGLASTRPGREPPSELRDCPHGD